MQKFILRATLFTGLSFLLIIGSGRLFQNKRKLQSFKFEEFRKTSGPVDIAIFGTSHAYTAYDPKVFENELNLGAFNFGAPLQNLEATALLIEQVLKERSIRLGVVDVFQSSLSEPPFGERVADFQYETLDYLELSWKKIRLHNHFFGPERVLDVFPTVRDHALWKERIFQPDYVLSRERDYYKGYLSELYFDKKGWRTATKDQEEYSAQRIKESIELSGEQKSMIGKVVEIFNSHGIPLIFVSAPIHKRYMDNTYYTYQHLLREHLNSLGVAFIDYNELWRDLDLHLYDFKDRSHLNSSGALKVSRYLAEFIKKNNRHLQDGPFEGNLDNTANRYYHLATGFREVIKHQGLSGTVSESTGAKEIAIFNDGYDRLEVLVTGDSLRDLKLRVEYKMPEHEARNLPPRVGNRIKGNRYAQEVALPNLRKEGKFKGYEFEGKQFKVLKVDCPFSQINQLKIFLGRDKPGVRVLEIEALQLE